MPSLSSPRGDAHVRYRKFIPAASFSLSPASARSLRNDIRVSQLDLDVVRNDFELDINVEDVYTRNGT